MLRAISAGPVYLSDRIGESDLKYILPLVDENGKIYRCDDVGKVTPDMLFEDPSNSKRILKIFNTCGQDGVVALFNLSDEPLETYVSRDDFYGSSEYIAYFWGKKIFSNQKRIKVRLSPKTSEIVNFYHVEGCDIYVGDLTKYISIADNKKTKMHIKEIY